MKKPALPEGFIITIDGTAASGKGSTASRLAEHLGMIHIDSGSIYRAVATLALEREIAREEEAEIVELLEQVTPELMSDESIRSERVSAHASHISKIPKLRERVHERLRKMTEHPVGAVVEGRDAGTKTFPNAPIKFFITATPEERARRRHKQLTNKGVETSLDQILEALKKRDHDDSTRALDPLVPAHDAIHIDSTNLSKDEVHDLLVKHISSKLDAAGS